MTEPPIIYLAPGASIGLQLEGNQNQQHHTFLLTATNNQSLEIRHFNPDGTLHIITLPQRT
jgi:hypothetical protein